LVTDAERRVATGGGSLEDEAGETWVVSANHIFFHRQSTPDTTDTHLFVPVATLGTPLASDGVPHETTDPTSLNVLGWHTHSVTRSEK